MLKSIAIAFALIFAVDLAGAAEVRVLSAGAVEPGLHAFAATVAAETGDTLAIQFNTPQQIAQRLAADEHYDIVVLPVPALNQAIKDGRVVAGSSVVLGRVGIGVVVRSNAASPDIASDDALKRDLLAADSIVYNAASTGIYLDRKFAEMGVADQIKSKTTRYPDGASVMEHVIKGKGNEIGLGAITEIKMYTGKGLRFVGPLPATMQNYTTYAAAAMQGAAAPEAASRVLKDLATARTRATFAAAGIE